MIKITEDDLKDLDLNGVVVEVSKERFPGFEFAFVTECAYTTKGKHGYPEPGYNPDESSFYHIVYNMEDALRDGFWMNRTSRFTLEGAFHFEYANYYKFEDMKEFCRWYLQQGNVTSTDELINSMWKMSDEIQQLRHENEKLREENNKLRMANDLTDALIKGTEQNVITPLLNDMLDLQNKVETLQNKINEVIGEDTES